MMGNVAKPDSADADEDGITVDVSMPARAPASVAIGVGAMLLGRYRIESRLGVGGLGSVYKAVDRVRNEHAHIDGCVALKIVHAGPDTPASVLDMLRHEFYCAQKLAHPSIVKVYELEGSDDLAFFTMELLDGEPLSELMKRSASKGLPRPQAWNIIREIGDGLAHAHSRGVVHGDLRPQNVMVLKAGGLRVLDFGAATVGDGTAAMTLAYASCQLLGGAEPEQRDDIFALACVAYELLTGAHPFQSRPATEARVAGMTVKEPKNLSAGQWQALQRGLAWESEDRPNSMQEWLTELVLSAAPRGKRSDSRNPESRKAGFGFTRWALALGVPLALASGWAVVHSMSSKPVIAEAVVRANEPELAAIPLPSEQDLKEREAKMLGVDDVAPTPVPPPKPKRVVKATGPVIEKIAFSERALNLEPGAKFAEIHVTRSEAHGDKTSFVWWTEPGSAAADADFVPQQHTTAYFPARNHLTTLFVKLVPNSKRKKSQVFYLNIAEASNGAAIGTTSRAAITLLPRGA
jgi:eukaryotic-like serine/threonine-protein kinase